MGLRSRAGAPLLIYIYTTRHVAVMWACRSRPVPLRDVLCSLGTFCGIKGVACLEQSLFKLVAATPTLLRATDHEILFYFRRHRGCLLTPFQCFHFESTWWPFYLFPPLSNVLIWIACRHRRRLFLTFLLKATSVANFVVPCVFHSKTELAAHIQHPHCILSWCWFGRGINGI